MSQQRQTLYSLPKILSVGFVGQEADGLISETDYHYVLEESLSLDSFSSGGRGSSDGSTKHYSLQVAVSLEAFFPELLTYCTYFRKPGSDAWFCVSVVGVQVMGFPDVVARVRHPTMLVYAAVNPKQAKADQIYNLVATRHELGTELLDRLSPLPFYTIEKRAILGLTDSKSILSMLCPHKKLAPGYYDVYKPKQYRHILYEEEPANVKQTRTLQPERLALRRGQHTFNRLLLGTTLLPTAVVEALLEEVAMSDSESLG